jgi:hypothetical protein
MAKDIVFIEDIKLDNFQREMKNDLKEFKIEDKISGLVMKQGKCMGRNEK